MFTLLAKVACHTPRLPQVPSSLLDLSQVAPPSLPLSFQVCHVSVICRLGTQEQQQILPLVELPTGNSGNKQQDEDRQARLGPMSHAVPDTELVTLAVAFLLSFSQCWLHAAVKASNRAHRTNSVTSAYENVLRQKPLFIPSLVCGWCVVWWWVVPVGREGPPFSCSSAVAAWPTSAAR